MVINAEPRHILRQLIYDNWGLPTPLDKASIGTKNFIVDRGNHIYQDIAVTVRRVRRDFKILSTGPTPLTLTWDRLAVGCWTQTDSQLETMVDEVIRIIDANRGIPASGVDDMIKEYSAPVDNLTERDSILAEEVIAFLTYISAT